MRMDVNARRKIGSVLASIAVPLAIEWVLLDLREQHRDFMVRRVLALLAVVLSPATGFVFLARQFPSRALALSCVYFPVMWNLLAYMAYLTALPYRP